MKTELNIKEIDAKDVVREYLKTNPELELPILTNIEKISNRIDSISNHFQKEMAKLIQVLPDYQCPNKIPEKIFRLHRENPSEAGIYAEKYLAFNPFIVYRDNFPFYEERNHEIVIEGIKIGWRSDFFNKNTDGLYEFKLTKSSNIKRSLREAFVQLHLYDFLFRIRYGVKHYFPITIEVCLIDKGVINTYRSGLNIVKMNQLSNTVNTLIKESNLSKINKVGERLEEIRKMPLMIEFNIDKELIKDIFKVNKFNNEKALFKKIDNVYDKIDPRTSEDILY